MYHYYHAMHCKLTNVFISAADEYFASTKSKKAIEPNMEDICGYTHVLLEDEGDASLDFCDAWMFHRFGKDFKNVPEEDYELPPLGIEEAIMLAPEIDTAPLKEYVCGKLPLGDAIGACLFGTYLNAFRLLGDKKGEPMPKELPSEEEVFALAEELDRNIDPEEDIGKCGKANILKFGLKS